MSAFNECVCSHPFNLVDFADDLSAYFSKFGNIVDCNLLLDRETGKSRGFGFITFDSVESVKNVLAQTPHKLKGKVVRFCFALTNQNEMFHHFFAHL